MSVEQLIEAARNSPECFKCREPITVSLWTCGYTPTTQAPSSSPLLMKNKHETPRAKQIADDGLIFLSQVGSGLHGVTVAGTDDRDEMGVCIEPPECVIGLEKFEQYQYRTQPEGKRSGPGDLDLVIYSLRKWAWLAAKGNPTVMLLMYAPESEIVTNVKPFGTALQNAGHLFLSREAGLRFKGYLQAQKERLLGERNQRTNRPELKEKYGFDTKFAYHAIRLGAQGTELLTNGTITLPMPEPAHTWLTDLRHGRHTLSEAIEHIEDLQYILQHLSISADLPPKADMAKVNSWLTEIYQEWWDRKSLLTKPRDKPYPLR